MDNIPHLAELQARHKANQLWQYRTATMKKLLELRPAAKHLMLEDFVSREIVWRAAASTRALARIFCEHNKFYTVRDRASDIARAYPGKYVAAELGVRVMIPADYLREACRYRNTRLVKYLYNRGHVATADIVDAVISAPGDDADLVQFLLQSTAASANAVTLALRAGNYKCAQLLHARGYAFDDNSLISAAHSGSLECLKFAHEHVARDDRAMEYAARSGNSECIEYLRQHYLWDSRYNVKVAEHGTLATLKKVYTFAPVHGDELEGAAKQGDLRMIEYLIAEGCPVTTAALKIAATHANSEALRYILQHAEFEEWEYDVARDLAIKAGVAKNFSIIFPYTQMINGPNDFIYVSGRGWLNCATIFITYADTLPNDVIQQAIVAAVQKDYLSTVKYLVSKLTEPVDVMSIKTALFAGSYKCFKYLARKRHGDFPLLFYADAADKKLVRALNELCELRDGLWYFK